MKIIVVGAGVLGSLYAARLQDSGQDVTVLARGVRLAEIQANGIVLEDAVTGERTVRPVRVIEQIDPAEPFDAAIVLVRANQLDELLPVLAECPNIPTVLLMTNQAAGPFAAIRALGRERPLFGFPGAGGTLRDGVVRCRLTNPAVQMTMLGEWTGEITPRVLELDQVLEGAGFPVQVSRQMDAWLKTHTAVVSPIANAIYLAGGSTRAAAATPDALVLLVRAIREGFRVLRAAGTPVTPARFQLLAALPEPLLVALLQRGFDTEAAELVLAQHAVHARDEMELLYYDFLALARTTSVKTPYIQALGVFLEPEIEPVRPGSRQLSLRWEEAALAVAGLLTGVWLLRRLRR